MPENNNHLHLRRLFIDTHQEPVVYMRQDCYVCRAEGFDAHQRVRICTQDTNGKHHTIIATVHMVTSDFLSHREAGLSESAWQLLNPESNQKAWFQHAAPADSMSAVRGKIYGNDFTRESTNEIISDITRGRYSDIQLAAFVTACSGSRLSNQEISYLTRAMVDAGSRLDWGRSPILDKHCVGGLPGNRTTPIVVAIVTAAGLSMPKTSSRAITSPAGTADTMETLAPVALSLEKMRQVVEQEGGCIAWGGSVSLSPADDILIRVERSLDLDSEGQLVASVISKKVAAGSTHVLIDLPIGITAKVRSIEYGERLATQLKNAGSEFGLCVETIFSDGQQPVGTGIGPALEAQDILAVLQGHPQAPKDLKERAITLAGKLLEMGSAAEPGEGDAVAESILTSGQAWQKFQAICEAQGGMRTPPVAKHQHLVESSRNGITSHINNRVIAKLAKLAGAPGAPAAGISLHTKLGDKVQIGTPLFTLHAETPGELHYALNFLESHPEAILIEEEVL